MYYCCLWIFLLHPSSSQFFFLHFSPFCFFQLKILLYFSSTPVYCTKSASSTSSTGSIEKKLSSRVLACHVTHQMSTTRKIPNSRSGIRIQMLCVHLMLPNNLDSDFCVCSVFGVLGVFVFYLFDALSCTLIVGMDQWIHQSLLCCPIGSSTPILLHFIVQKLEKKNEKCEKKN